ncbi:alpha/beta hydrolase [bacterium D16-76]|nr:alpha/beta hydrolase [bacterium D16-76]
MRKRKRAIKIFFLFAAAVAILLLILYINHQIRLKMEAELRLPLGRMVEVDGHNMSIYVEGTGDTTLVFMSGGGTCSPILDFKSLYSLLSDKYSIAVVEKFGYGFSDVVDKDRDIDSILEDTRAALAAAGLNAPYVLCPHSMSGLEALYWAQKYPDEISAIIGLDMAVPEYYDSMNINIPLMRLASWVANIGVTRFIPGLSDSDAIKHGTLSEDEKEIYKAIFYSRTATVTMINETAQVKKNAEKVSNMGVPQLPILLFISDGSGGTGFDKETWRRIPIEYISQVDKGKYIELNCPHYVHDYAYKAIREHIAVFLSEYIDSNMSD